MAKKNLPVSELYKAEKLFKRKGWSIEDEGLFSQYNGYLSRIAVLPEDTRDLFFQLTERFENLGLNEIVFSFNKSYEKIDKKFIDSYRKIYFLPLVNPIIEVEDKVNRGFFSSLLTFLKLKKKLEVEIERPEQKSADRIYSFIQIEYRNLYASNKFVFPKSFLKFKEVYNNETDAIILVDDFIGTGDTAANVLDFYIKKSKFKAKNINIISLVSQKAGIERIFKDYKIPIYSHITQGKALSDFYNEDKTLLINQNLVIKMSEKLKIKRDYFGYKDSEALVCILNKSPNNTLPIFWHESKNHPAPFPRAKIFKN